MSAPTVKEQLKEISASVKIQRTDGAVAALEKIAENTTPAENAG